MSEIEFKYTRDGKKVVVLGKLNSQQWIVQEVFISNGQEFPSGESFIETTLLDEPAETWQVRREKEIEKRANRLEESIKRLNNNVAILERKATVAQLINRATDRYQNIDLAQLDTLFAFVSGQITHIITTHWHDYKIESLVDAVEATDSSGYSGVRCDGLRLVSLFGCNTNGERYEKDRSFSLDWKINQYRDGSGSGWDAIYPCKSFDEAVSTLDELIATENVTDKLIQLKQKYGLKNPSDEKIAEYRNLCVESKKKSVEKAQLEVEKLKNELQAMEVDSSCQE